MELSPPASTPARRGFSTRLFGYDVFISFALGAPPRGSQSYASDLARRLRERDFAVFFSEEEAPPGMVLDAGLKRALASSKMLVVIANRGTLAAPRWIRTEVEEFRRRHPTRPIVPISVDGALLDPELTDGAQQWLQFRDRIWLDERGDAVDRGMASDGLVDRLASAPNRLRSNVRWRWLVSGVLALLVGLAFGLFAFAMEATHNAEKARAELRRAISQKLATEAPRRLTGELAGGDERALIEAVIAARLMPGASSDVALLDVLLERHALVRLASVAHRVDALAWSPDGRWIAHSGLEGTLEIRDAVTLAAHAPVGRHEEGIARIAWCGDRRIVTGGAKGGRPSLDRRGGLRPYRDR